MKNESGLTVLGRVVVVTSLTALSLGGLFIYASSEGLRLPVLSWPWTAKTAKIEHLSNSNFQEVLHLAGAEGQKEMLEPALAEGAESLLVVECADCGKPVLGLAELSSRLKKEHIRVVAIDVYRQDNGSSCFTSALAASVDSGILSMPLKLWSEGPIAAWRQTKLVWASGFFSTSYGVYKDCRSMDADFLDQFEEALVKPPVMNQLIMPAASKIHERPLGRALMAVYPKFLFFDRYHRLVLADIGLSGKDEIDSFIKDAKGLEQNLTDLAKAALEAKEKAEREAVNTLPGSIMARPATPHMVLPPLPFMAVPGKDSDAAAANFAPSAQPQ